MSDRFDEIHFVEGSPFASRLHVLSALAHGCVDEKARVTIHMPPRGDGDDLSDFIEGLPPNVEVRIDRSLDEAAPRSFVRIAQIRRLMANALRSSRGTRRIVVLTAIDDYPRALPLITMMSMFRRDLTVALVRYRVDDLPSVTARRSFRQLLKRVYFALFTSLGNAWSLVFDERLSGRHRTVVLPDPWSGPFGDRDRQASRLDHSLEESDVLVTMVGYQDARKGFGLAVEVLRRLGLTGLTPRIAIVGRVDSNFRDDLDLLLSAHPGRVEHHTTYISDEELAGIMAASDAILLPYSRSFTSTSGVLARSAASGTPVLATASGLVGWRVERYELGSVFPEDEPQLGADALREMLRNRERSAGGKRFAASCSVEATARAFRDFVRAVES